MAELEAVNVTATGDGHRMALEAGATVVNGDIVRGPIMRFVPPSHDRLMLKLPPWRWLARGMRWAMDNLPEAVLRPFAMSFLTTALGALAGAVQERRDPRQPQRRSASPTSSRSRRTRCRSSRRSMTYIVFDRKLAERFTAWPYYVSTAPGIAYAYLADYRRNRADIYHEAATVEGLARSMGVPADALARTLAEYNASGRGDAAGAGCRAVSTRWVRSRATSCSPTAGSR